MKYKVEDLKLQQNKIKKYGNMLKNPVNNKFKDVNTHSWFDIKISNEKQLFKNNKFKIKSDELQNDGFYTTKIKLYPTEKQKLILFKWLDYYIKMYNETIKYFKKCNFNKNKPSLNIGILKKELKNSKENIIKLSIKSNCKVNSHMLDYAINDASNNFKSHFTNLKRKNIKHFRLRYIKLNKKKKIFKLEKSSFTNVGFCVSIFDKMKCCLDNFNYVKNIETVATICYYNNLFYLLLRKKKNQTNNKKRKIISIDLGIRTYITGYTSTKIIKIGTQSNKIKEKLEVIDKLSQKKPKSIWRKIINKKYDRIKNMMNDFKWKTINYLIKNYKMILIGNFSTKSMGETKMNDMVKRIANLYNIFDFKQKLKYKCFNSQTKYKEINESYTSKCCSCCGYYKKNLGGSKVYICNNCKKVIDRDVNGAKNIMMRSI